MNSARFREIFPGALLDHAGIALDELRTIAKGFRRSTSVGGLATGMGANLIIVDDPLKAIEAESEQVRQTIYDWVKGTLMSRFAPGETGKMIVIMQRLHQDDLIGRLRDDGGWAVLEMPAEAYKPVQYDLGRGQIWTLKPGDLLYPEGFDASALAERRSSMSEAAYNAQFLQRPDAAQGTLFKTKYFQRYDQPPFPHHVEAIVQSWDPALTEESNGAFSVCTTWAISGLKLYLLDVFRRRMEFPKLAYTVRSLQKKFKADHVIIEVAGVGKALYQDLSSDPELVGRLHSASPKLGKLERAIAQTPMIERKRVYLPTSAPWLEAFEGEVAAFPLGKYADQVDSMVQFLRAMGFVNAITMNLKARDGAQMFY